MTTLVIALALVALVGFIFIWLRLQQVKAAVAHLAQLHQATATGAGARKRSPDVGPLPDIVEVPPDRFIILGYRAQSIIFENFSSGDEVAIKEFKIGIPEGTTAVAPSINGFILLFGKITNPNPEGFNVEATDHHVGFEMVHITVTEITQTEATLKAQLLLRDLESNAWSGVLSYTVLLLGKHP